MTGHPQHAQLLILRQQLTDRMCQSSDTLAEQGFPYAVSPELVLQRAEVYKVLGYADLAIADAYVAFSVAAGEEEELMAVGLDGRLWDEESEDGGEEKVEHNGVQEDISEQTSQHEASESGDEGSAIGDRDRQCRIEDVEEKRVVTKRDALRIVVRGLGDLGCTRELPRWQSLLQEAEEEIQTKHNIKEDDEDRSRWIIYDDADDTDMNGAADYIAQDSPQDGKRKCALFGLSRREVYPWNNHELDRMSKQSLSTINQQLFEASNGCLEVRETLLPHLSPASIDPNGPNGQHLSKQPRENVQLGLFALRDFHPGETILHEHSVLTAIRLHDAPLCDACATELPTSSNRSSIESSTDDSQPKVYACPGCDIPFCSQKCLSTALTTYHTPNPEDVTTDCDYPPAISPFCPGKSAHADIHQLGRAESSEEPEWDLYFLLVARCIMMAETRKQSPLELDEVKWLWGDFNSLPNFECDKSGVSAHTNQQGGHKSGEDFTPKHTLPYSIHHSLLLPFKFFTTLLLSVPNCAPYSSHWLRRYDWWIIQTLYAKFRGVADAKESTWDGKAESAGVFGLWCLANHSCAPNVEWETRRDGNETGGERVFEVREEVWRPPSKEGGKIGEQEWQGIKKGDEIWNHYTDTREEDFRVRRGRLREVLGGDCMCERCIWDEKDAEGKSKERGKAPGAREI